MNILVFGATGGTGQQFVRQALARGHRVTACVRNPRKLDIEHANLQIVVGDMLQPESLAAIVREPFDAVFLAIGVYHRKPQTFVSDGTRNIVQAVQQAGITRIAVVTSLGCGESKGQGNLLARLFQRLSLPEVIADKDRQETVLMESDLEWTIVRPPRLLNNDEIRDDLVVWQGPTPTDRQLTWACNRANVADLLLRSLEQGSHIRTALTVSDPK